MALSAKAGFKGIVTACGEVTADPGALRVADNVTLRREGAIALRATFGSTALSRAYKAAYPYKGSLYYIGGSNVVYSPSQAALTFTYTGANGSNASTSPAALRDDIAGMKEARGNLYVATAEGVFKVTSTSDTSLYRAGVSTNEIYPGSFSLVAGSMLPNNMQVAYRLVTVMTDANGVVIRSRPSGAIVVQNTTGGGFVSGHRVLRSPDRAELYGDEAPDRNLSHAHIPDDRYP